MMKFHVVKNGCSHKTHWNENQLRKYNKECYPIALDIKGCYELGCESIVSDNLNGAVYIEKRKQDHHHPSVPSHDVFSVVNFKVRIA